MPPKTSAMEATHTMREALCFAKKNKMTVASAAKTSAVGATISHGERDGSSVEFAVVIRKKAASDRTRRMN